MIEAVRQLLSESAQNTLETMFFITPDRISTELERPEGELIAASVTFQGAPPGRFGMVVSARAARGMAANFLGSEDDAKLPLAQVSGVMGELANIICGTMLSELQSDANFDLAEPFTLHASANEPGPDFLSGSPVAVRFETPEGAIIFSFAFEERA
jgi:CheY-specific phosphatase CheX